MARTKNRSHLLIGGRRIRIADLIAANLLEPSQRLTFSRPSFDRTYEAIVQPDGSLVIDGEPFTTPSSAARSITETSVDGWHAWRVGDDGPYIHSLREKLLKIVRDGLSKTGNAANLVDRHDFLSSVDEGGIALTVAELLRHWGADTRVQSVTDDIDADLLNNDLITEPNYLKVGITDTIVLQRKGRTSDEDPSAVEPETRTADLQDIGITVGNLPSARKEVKAISQNGTIEQAITEMALNGFSQIAVMGGPRSIKGAVTWQSIARARNRRPDARLADAIVDVPKVGFDKPLIDALPELQQNDFVFVTDVDGTLAGIVTNADVVDAYRSFSTPYLLIGELDQILRRILSESVDPEKIWAVCGPNEKPRLELPQMTMHDYQLLLGDEEIWSLLRWPIDRKILLNRLDELRRVRNDVMHFNRDAIPDDQIAIFREAIRLIKELAGD